MRDGTHQQASQQIGAQRAPGKRDIALQENVQREPGDCTQRAANGDEQVL